MKKRGIGFVSLLVLLGSYWLFRYPLFETHGMKDWPLCLLVVAMVVTVISGVIMTGKVLPISAVCGYLLGFFAGYLFQFDYGEGRNSLWIIWTCCFGAAVIIGILISVFGGIAQTRRQRESG
jgi:hypothetical protein